MCSAGNPLRMSSKTAHRVHPVTVGVTLGHIRLAFMSLSVNILLQNSSNQGITEKIQWKVLLSQGKSPSMGNPAGPEVKTRPVSHVERITRFMASIQ